MPVRAVCACGAAYNLKDQYAGARLGCPKCGGPVDAPALPPAPPVRAQEGDPVFAADKFLLDERHFDVSEKYSVTDTSGRQLLFVERPNYPLRNVLAYAAALGAGALNILAASVLYGVVKAAVPDPVLLGSVAVWQRLGSLLVVLLGVMAFPQKRHVTVYRDGSRKETLLKITQDRRLQLFSASYTVADPGGKTVARLRKNRLRNIFRKRWYCLDPGGKLLFIAREDSMILSILRRFLLGFFGLLRTDYVFYGPGWRVLGEFNRRMTLQDRYVLDLTPDSLRSLDRRAALALGVMLDTGEGR